mmetsp:Transcript_12194/g.22857  ORF Transcript_12194/g.22857 Transcript_12194/m.22857 type:complete len:288 (+) Transcript_12194:1882-2745(+)
MKLNRLVQTAVFLSATTTSSRCAYLGKNECSILKNTVIAFVFEAPAGTDKGNTASSALNSCCLQRRRSNNLQHHTTRNLIFSASYTATSTVRSLSSSPNNYNDNTNPMNRPDAPSQALIFGKFKISPSQIFYKSPSDLTAAIVNLRPIVPGHVLVIPKRIVAKLSDLTNDEYDDLWRSVRIVQSVLEKHYNAGGFNVSVQDGRVAGQSVPHVHVHILPRQKGDFERNDDVYDKLEEWAPTIELSEDKKKDQVELDVPEDDDRKDRTMEMMENESMLYRALLGIEANI